MMVFWVLASCRIVGWYFIDPYIKSQQFTF
jgi:hypothetical protein